MTQHNGGHSTGRHSLREPVYLIRRQVHTGIGLARERFVPLGIPILSAENFKRAEPRLVQAGMIVTQFNINSDVLEEFQQLCADHSGHRAALVQDSPIRNIVTPEPGMRAISSPLGFESVPPMLKLIDSGAGSF